MKSPTYTSTMNSGLGKIEETRILLNLWQPHFNTTELQQVALSSGYFPTISARRLRNLIVESFAPCYLRDRGAPAIRLQKLAGAVTNKEFEQLLFIYNGRAHPIFADFVTQLYWPSYAAGRETISTEEAYDFVIRAIEDGKTTTTWSENTSRRVARYLTGYCADFGLLEKGQKSVKRILPYRLEQKTAVYLAYDLHFAGHSDNSIVTHQDWALFGLTPADVLDELKRLALRGWLIVQAAGSVVRLGWQYDCMEDLIHALTDS
ncbi:MAG: DUF1819 family protein [Anaerolineae bacterium]|nr:DUF1819 family protein [Anaerolineae bacterium]